MAGTPVVGDMKGPFYHFSNAMLWMGVSFIIAVALPLDSDWTSQEKYKCSLDDGKKHQCAVPLTLTAAVFMMVAGLLGTIAGGMDKAHQARKILCAVAALFTLVSFAVWLSWMSIRASVFGGYRWKSWKDAAENPEDGPAAVGYQFFQDFGVLYFLFSYMGCALHNIMGPDPHHVKITFAGTAFCYSLWEGIYWWSLSACSNNDDEIQCKSGTLLSSSSAGWYIDDWKVRVIVAAWSIAFIGTFFGTIVAPMKHLMAARGVAGLLFLTSLLYFIAVCGIANEYAKMDSMPNNSGNRAAAAQWFLLLAYFKPVAFVGSALVFPDDEAGALPEGTVANLGPVDTKQ